MPGGTDEGSRESFASYASNGYGILELGDFSWSFSADSTEDSRLWPKLAAVGGGGAAATAGGGGQLAAVGASCLRPWPPGLLPFPPSVCRRRQWRRCSTERDQRLGVAAWCGASGGGFSGGGVVTARRGAGSRFQAVCVDAATGRRHHRQ